ncbi:hypothetical protein G6F55_005698 [Rhizopus delemar]|uniref:rhizopuspepsin n=1 Tax=Rhizopus delemar TaxID=936053 RepID=A0A9P6Z1S2_9FUNG|nr:hypothetical protein G6F55_005698 [Rhizopus delemar]KAG1568975.1 hypothetical protein G6F50_006801 [Rhizopus delemar]
MIIFTLLISKVITCIVAQKLISIPFQAVERRELKAAAYGNRHLGAPLANVDLAYLIQIEIGTPPQPFYLLLDTGSSSTWVPIVGCNRDCGYPYHTLQPSRSSTFNSSYLPFSIHYGEGFSSGYYAQDSVTVNGVTIPEVNFAVSNYNDGELTMDGADGILGIGPDILSIYDNPENKVIPTLVTTMYEKGVIGQKVFSVYFQPVLSEKKRINGEIVFGGVEARHITGEVHYVPVSNRTEYMDYWAVDLQSIRVGSYRRFYTYSITAMVDTGAHRDITGQYVVPCNTQNLPEISIQLNNTDFTITPKHYLITSGVLTYSKEYCYTYIQDSPSFVDAILGYGFLQQYVSVYDHENKRIGFAKRAQ